MKKSELSMKFALGREKQKKRTAKQSLMATMYVLSLVIVHLISARWVNKQLEN